MLFCNKQAINTWNQNVYVHGCDVRHTQSYMIFAADIYLSWTSNQEPLASRPHTVLALVCSSSQAGQALCKWVITMMIYRQTSSLSNEWVIVFWHASLSCSGALLHATYWWRVRTCAERMWGAAAQHTMTWAMGGALPAANFTPHSALAFLNLVAAALVLALCILLRTHQDNALPHRTVRWWWFIPKWPVKRCRLALLSTWLDTYIHTYTYIYTCMNTHTRGTLQSGTAKHVIGPCTGNVQVHICFL
jgi:hypothetical protein